MCKHNIIVTVVPSRRPSRHKCTCLLEFGRLKDRTANLCCIYCVWPCSQT